MDRLLSMRVFACVIDQGSFAAAARTLDLSAAVVTRLVADLEAHLGTRLLQRSTRNLALTAEGEVYAEGMRHILHDIDEIDAAASSHTLEVAGELHISAPPVLATHMLAPLVAGFRQAYPNIHFDVHVDPLNTLTIESYDITLLAVGAQFNANVIAHHISTTDTILVASPAYLLRRGLPQQPEDLSQHDCLLLRTSGLRSQTLHLTHKALPEQAIEVPVTPVLWVNHTDTLMRAVLSAAGITAVSQDLAAPLIASGALVQVLRPWIAGQLSVYAAFPSRKFMPRRTRIFLDYLIEHTKNQNFPL